MDSIYNIEIEYNNGEKSINQFCIRDLKNYLFSKIKNPNKIKSITFLTKKNIYIKRIIFIHSFKHKELWLAIRLLPNNCSLKEFLDELNKIKDI